MKEIERKFVLNEDGNELMKKYPAHDRLIQGYLRGSDGKHLTRIRIESTQFDSDHQIATFAWLTIKAPDKSFTRWEFEYRIPEADARAMLNNLCHHIVEKTRIGVRHEDLDLEIDVFHGINEGLVMLEIELESEDQPIPEIPFDVKKEVTHDDRYTNYNLGV